MDQYSRISLLSLPESTDSERHETSADEARLEEGALGSFGKALFDSGIQAPTNGAIELVELGINKVSDGSLRLPRVSLVETAPVEFASGKWHARELGHAVGMAVPFLLTRKLIGLRSGAKGGIKAAVARPATLAESVVAGGVYGTVFQEAGEAGLPGRLENGITSGVLFGALDGMTRGVSRIARRGSGSISRVMQNQVPASIAAGVSVAAGISEVDALRNGQLLPDADALYENSYRFAFLGAAIGGAAGVARLVGGGTKSGAVVRSGPERELVAGRELRSRNRSGSGAGEPVNVVLDAGGAKGAGHIGFLKYLEESGVNIKNEYGVSIGSFVATLHKNGYSASDIMRILGYEVHQGMLGPMLPSRLSPRTALRFKDTRPVMEKFVSKYGLEPVDGLSIVASRFRGRDPVIFSGTDYDLATAMAASTAIPGFYRWVRYGADGSSRHVLVDGALGRLGIEHLPSGTTLFSSLPRSSTSAQGQGLLGRGINRIANTVSVDSFFTSGLKAADKQVIVVPVSKPGISKFDFFMSGRQYREAIRHGYGQAQRVLDGLLPQTV